MKRFLEDEAELGSDNEENDDVRKDIAIDGEEDEEGLDEDLKDFVVHEGDDAEIGDESEDMRLKHQRDMEALDRLEIQRTMEAVIFGRNNKKRKRDEVDGLDDYDNGDRRKMRLIEERMKQLQDGNAEPEDIILAAA